MPFVQQLPRKAGQKEVRYMHLLGGTIDLFEDDAMSETGSRTSGDLEARVSQLEHDLAEMKEAFDKLMKDLMG
jgi:uncharacterized protein YceH (UPF0502 family)